MTFPQKFAEKLGVTRQTIYRWETGQSMPDIQKLMIISEIYSVSIDYLLNDKIDNSIGKLTDYILFANGNWVTILKIMW